jgi:WD40 repeat protein
MKYTVIEEGTMKPKYPRIVWGEILWVVALVMLASAAHLSGQQVIENPEKPLAKNAGRVLELKQIWRISDESAPFYFKYPLDLQIAADGSIFLVDEEEFLHFTSDGKFIKNLYKKGEGPGEISRGLDYFILGQELIIWDSNKRKVWSTDYDGNLLREFEIPNTGYTGFLGIRKDDFVFTKTVNPPIAERTGLIEIPRIVYLTSMDGKSERQIYTFKSKTFSSSRASRSWTPSIALLSPDGKYLVGSHSSEYTIRIVDIEQGKVIRTFTRKYPRVKHPENDFEREFNKKFNAPKMEYEPDVRGMRLSADRIWVGSSTTDPKKGDLWDVFSMDGKFLDSLYLGPGRRLLKVDPDTIFVSEENADKTISIAKCKIIG